MGKKNKGNWTNKYLNKAPLLSLSSGRSFGCCQVWLWAQSDIFCWETRAAPRALCSFALPCVSVCPTVRWGSSCWLEPKKPLFPGHLGVHTTAVPLLLSIYQAWHFIFVVKTRVPGRAHTWRGRTSICCGSIRVSHPGSVCNLLFSTLNGATSVQSALLLQQKGWGNKFLADTRV